MKKVHEARMSAQALQFRHLADKRQITGTCQDLAIGRRCGAKQREQRQSVARVPNLHRSSPIAKPHSSKHGASSSNSKWDLRSVSSNDQPLLSDTAEINSADARRE